MALAMPMAPLALPLLLTAESIAAAKADAAAAQGRYIEVLEKQVQMLKRHLVECGRSGSPDAESSITSSATSEGVRHSRGRRRWTEAQQAR